MALTMMEKGKFPYPKDTYVFRYPELYDDSKLVLNVDYAIEPLPIELENGTFTIFAEHVPLACKQEICS